MLHYSSDDCRNPNFESLGYTSRSVIDNLGSMAAYLVGVILLIFFVLGLKYL
jgi:hypothetical protein